MSEFLSALTRAIGMIKGFECGYTSKCKDKFIVDYKGKRYLVELKEVPVVDESMFQDIDIHCR